MTTAIVEHRKFICVEFGETNNNKVWEYTLYDNDDVLVAWGRIGNKLQSKTHQGAGHSKVVSLIRKKTNPNNSPDKLYTEVKSIETGGSVSVGTVKNAQLVDVARKQIKHKNPLVQQLIDYLVTVNAHQIMSQSGGKIQYNSSTAQFKTPLGVINPLQVKEARTLLVDIADFVSVNDYDNKQFPAILNKYLRLIPHDVGMSKISPEMIFPSFSSVQSENDLLDGLDTSFIDVTTVPNTTDTKKKTSPKVFDVELSIVEDDKIIKRIEENVKKTSKKNHSCNHLRIKTIYAVSIKCSEERFNEVVQKIGNIHELYHGTSTQNLLSILRAGFRITPPLTAHITGKMFGTGIYTSPNSSKALNYSYGYWSGIRNNRCFMFLVDVICGKIYTPHSYNESFPKKGYDSTWAKANISGVMNDEVIVYKNNQCNPTYLLEFN